MRRVHPHWIKLTILLLILNYYGWVIATSSNSPKQILSIEINVQSIYKDSAKNSIHQFANGYHVNTKEQVILTLLPMKIGDWVSNEQLVEGERLLRQQIYLRDASLTLTSEGILQVTVIDNWTLFPTLSFSRTGRENSSSIGVRDTNLLGLGIATTLNYKKDPQKSGYRFHLSTPTSFAEHSYASVIFEDYDTGNQQSLAYEKPFYTINTDSMLYTYAGSSDLENIFYHNDSELGFAATEQKQFELKYGWLESYSKNTAYRSLIGLSSYSLELTDYNLDVLTDFFTVREKSYLWWGKEQFDSQFEVFKNVYVISNKEDINLGLHTNYKIGVGQIKFVDTGAINSIVADTEKSDMLSLSYAAAIGHKIDNQLLIIQQLNVNNEIYRSNNIKDYFNFGYQLSIFYPLDRKLSFYTGSRFSYTSQFRESPQALGGESGLRGYPTAYQYGKKRWLTTLEARYYSDINLWDTFAIGWVGFVDVGKAWDSSIFENIDKHSLASVGIGIRIFPKVASGRNVIHVDLARPYSNNDEVDGWEWRVQVKSSF